MIAIESKLSVSVCAQLVTGYHVIFGDLNNIQRTHIHKEERPKLIEFCVSFHWATFFLLSAEPSTQPNPIQSNSIYKCISICQADCIKSTSVASCVWPIYHIISQSHYKFATTTTTTTSTCVFRFCYSAIQEKPIESAEFFVLFCFSS